MKDIKCPYYWFCGETFNVKDLSKHDSDFVNDAISKGMAFMFIHCPKCKTQIQFNPIKWEETAMYDNPNEKEVTKKIKTKKEALDILRNENIKLITGYIDFLSKKNSTLEVSIIEGRNKFRLYTLSELCEKVNINNEAYLQIKSIAGFLKSVPEELKEWIEDEIPFNELMNCLIVGYENTSYLFIDNRDEKTLWIFESGDIYIKKTQFELNDIIKNMKIGR
ncbi:hypothetical protein [Dysgonomonas sp. ZJ709]|uniref:hypothetical protein n=1 Tax=Dysgonomonas sp. ZJ709 TaxID=2709797 RepID=UPI0013EC3CF8|nr:hypothetical protein [Dysgonomonas sp. ZJ709]